MVGLLRQRGGNRHPLSVTGFTSKDEKLAEVVAAIQLAIRQHDRLRIYEGAIEDALKRAGATCIKMSGYNLAFPQAIAKACGHTGGNIDIYAEFSDKRAGIEVEPVGWYRACESELLKLGWSDLDYRIIAWGVRQPGPIRKLVYVEMLPFPNPVLVITQFGIMEVSNGD